MYTLRALTGILLATATTAAIALIGGGVADAAGNYFQLGNITTGKCADVKARSQNAGAIVQQWACANEDNQRWAPTDAGGGFLTLQNQRSGYCMAVRDDANFNGAQVIQAECNPSAPGQLWRQEFVTVSGIFRLVSGLPGKCLEVDRANHANGAKIQIWDCDSASNAQGWVFG